MADWMNPQPVSADGSIASPVGPTPVARTESTNKVGDRIPNEQVRKFHLDDDVDQGNRAHHHTLGFEYGQAAPGQIFKQMYEEYFWTESVINSIMAGSYKRGVVRQQRSATLTATTTGDGYVSTVFAKPFPNFLHTVVAVLGDTNFGTNIRLSPSAYSGHTLNSFTWQLLNGTSIGGSQTVRINYIAIGG